MFHVGQQVVCVDDRPFKDGTPCCFTRGRIYDIEAICTKGHRHNGIPTNEIGLDIRGHRQHGSPGWCSCVSAARFRPVRPQSIEWAREIARDVKQPQRENV